MKDHKVEVELRMKYTLLAHAHLLVAKFISLFNRKRAIQHMQWVLNDMEENLKKYVKVSVKKVEGFEE